MKKHESVLGKVRSILGISVLNAISKNATWTRERRHNSRQTLSVYIV